MRVTHHTIYRDHEPVHFTEHRFMCRPRDSHDLRLLDTGIRVSPSAALRWLLDGVGNSVVVARFDQPSDVLSIKSTVLAEHHPAALEVSPVETFAELLSFGQAASEEPALARRVERQYNDPTTCSRPGLGGVRESLGSDGTLDTLVALTQRIKADFRYRARDEEGTRTPAQTLALGEGSCRDFALLMMEAVRSLGVASRFVSATSCPSSRRGSRGRASSVADRHTPGARCTCQAPGGSPSTRQTPSLAANR